MHTYIYIYIYVYVYVCTYVYIYIYKYVSGPGARALRRAAAADGRYMRYTHYIIISLNNDINKRQLLLGGNKHINNKIAKLSYFIISLNNDINKRQLLLGGNNHITLYYITIFNMYIQHIRCCIILHYMIFHSSILYYIELYYTILWYKYYGINT